MGGIDFDAGDSGMAEQEHSLGLQAQSAKSQQGDEQDIAAHFSRGTPGQLDDPSRSTLHSGERSSGKLDEAVQIDGAPSSPGADPTLNYVPYAETGAADSQPAGSHAVQTGESSALPGEPIAGDGEAQQPLTDPVAAESGLWGSDAASVVNSDIPLILPSKPGVSRDEAAQNAPITEKQQTNRPPQELTLDGTTVSENADGAIVGTLGVIDPDAGDTHTFQVSDDRFEVVGTQLRLKSGVALDHETASRIELHVTVTDTDGHSLTERLFVDVTNVNEAPEAINLDAAWVAENATGAIIGNISTVDPDFDDQHTFSVSDDRFIVEGGQLRLKPDVTLNHEDAAQIKIDMTAMDAGGLGVTHSFTINVQDINEGPQNLQVHSSPQNLIRNGSFESFDLAAGRWRGFTEDDTGAWTGSDGIEIWDRLGDTAASDGDQLLELDHGRGLDSIEQIIQTQKGQLYDLALDVRERVTDGTDTVEVYWNGNLIETLDPETADWQTFNLQVVGTGEDRLELRETDGQNDTYGALVDNITLSVAELTVAENTAGAIVGQIGFDDPDDGDTHRFDVSDDRFHVVDGQLALKPGVALDHAAASTLDIDVTVTDSGGLSETRTVSVRVAEQAEMHINSGFHASYFDVDRTLNKLDDIDWAATPTHQEFVSEVNYENGKGSFWKG
ncbi:MAG: hypothetical protein AAF402_17340, partial [Pseudomonadota bacterium]